MNWSGRKKTNCIVCGLDIDPEIAIYNTGKPDCCDSCSINRRKEYLKLSKEAPHEQNRRD